MSLGYGLSGSPPSILFRALSLGSAGISDMIYEIFLFRALSLGSAGISDMIYEIFRNYRPLGVWGSWAKVWAVGDNIWNLTLRG